MLDHRSLSFEGSYLSYHTLMSFFEQAQLLFLGIFNIIDQILVELSQFQLDFGVFSIDHIQRVAIGFRDG